MKRPLIGILVILVLMTGCVRSETPQDPTIGQTDPPRMTYSPNDDVDGPTAAERRRERKERQKARQRARMLAQRAEPELIAGFEQMLADYNSGDFVHASAFFSDDLMDDCGGPTDFGFAFAQNDRAERLNYVLDGINAHRYLKGAITADVTWSSFDENNGEVWDDHFVGGFVFIREDGGWVLRDLFPLGVGAFCD